MERKEFFNADVIINLLRAGDLDFDLLESIKFNPYWPYELNPPSEFTTRALNDLNLIINLLPRNILSKIHSIRVVGSACVGLAGAFPYGVRKIRYDDYYHLSSVDTIQSDLDVEILINLSDLEEVFNFFQLTGQNITNRQSSPGDISLAFYSYDEVISLASDPYSALIQRYAVWSNRSIVFHGEEILNGLRTLTRQTVDQASQEEKGWFWHNLADRYYFHQKRLMIKRGDLPELFLRREEVPTLFDPRLRTQKRNKSVLII